MASRPAKKRKILASGTDAIAMAGASSKSSLFRLQVDELLEEIRPNQEKSKAEFEGTLRTLKELIERIPARAPLPVVEAERTLRKSSKVTVPFPEPRPGIEAKYTLEYRQPSSINVVGSFALGIGTRSQVPALIDLAVTIPKVLFQEKDYLNYRYFHKRAYYIACVAAGITNAGSTFDVRFAYQNDNTLQPILIVQPSQERGRDQASKKLQVRVIVAIPEDTFAPSKILPYKCNVRNQNSYQDPSKPSAFYNATLRAESCVDLYLKFLHSALVLCEAFRDSCLLGRTWLQQRGFATDESNGGFGGFEWTAVCATLLQGGGRNGRPLLSPQYDSYQLFKATLQFLAGKRFASPFLWKSADAEVLGSTMPVFYDGIRDLNLTYKMSQWSYKQLRTEAQTTLVMLSDSKFDHFDSTFIIKSHEPLLRFDVVMKVPNLAKSRSTMDFQRQTYNVVSQSLGDRAKLVSLSGAITSSWPLQSAAPTTRDKGEVTVGIILDPEHARRVVDHGPPAKEKEASAEFRDFWGDKAELRRFKDGSILESLVWLGESSAPPVVQQILLYALRRHLGKELTKEVNIVGYQDELVMTDDPNSADTTAPFQHFMEAFQGLEKQLRDSDGLPLSLKQLAATDPQVRYTSIHSHSSTKYSTPAAVVIEFEGSGRWPDDLSAAQQIKTAFLLKIGELLEIATKGLVAKIGTENETVPLMGNTFLDIVYPTGLSFRLRVHHEREQTFLARLLKDKSSNALLKQEASYALSAYKRTYLHAPRHAQAVRTLCTRFPYLSPAIRLFKMWCSAHLLSNHLAEELMELLVIRVFVQPFPWEAPSSTMTGFLRTLHLLSRWDWPREPLIVDSSGSLTPEDITGMNTRFETWRKIDPAMNTVVLFVASNLDPDGVAWTQGKPLKVVAGRLSGLTKAAMSLVKDRGLGLNIKDLFEPGLGDYDFVIHLKEKFTNGLPVKSAHESSRFKNLQLRDVPDCDLVGYDPTSRCLDELEQAHRNSIVFFYGGQGSSIITGLWNPQMSFKPFRLKLTYSSAPVPEPEDESGEEMVSLNRPAILNEIASLGGDMVKRIDINRS